MMGKFILLFVVWIGLSNSLHYQELIVGGLISFIVSFYFTKDGDFDLFKEIKKYVKFTPLFIKDLILANIEVAKIVLNPKLPINPAIIKLETNLKNDFNKLLLANAITLTPGTITLEVDKNDIYIHILNLKTKDKKVLQEEIINRYEIILENKGK